MKLLPYKQAPSGGGAMLDRLSVEVEEKIELTFWR